MGIFSSEVFFCRYPCWLFHLQYIIQKQRQNLMCKYNNYFHLINIFYQMSMVQFFQTAGFIKHNKSKIKSNFTQYIYNQQKQDQKVKNLLNLLRTIICKNHEIYSLINIANKPLNQNEQIIINLENNLNAISPKHRSYHKIKSLTLNSLVKIHMLLGNIQMASILIEQALISDKTIAPHFYTRSLLYKILLTEKYNKLNNSQVIEINNNKNCINSNQEQFNLFSPQIYKDYNGKQIKTSSLYSELKKIKIAINYQQYAAEQRLWENRQINQLLIYQYHYIVKQISIISPKKGCRLYEKGVQISKKVLGIKHNLTDILVNIQKIQKSRKYLFKSQKKTKTYRFRNGKRLNTQMKTINDKDDPQKYPAFRNTISGTGSQDINLNQKNKFLTKTFNHPSFQKKKINQLLHINKQAKLLKKKANLHVQKLCELDQFYSEQNSGQCESEKLKIILEKETKKVHELQKKKELVQYIKHKNIIKGGRIINQEQLVKKGEGLKTINSQAHPMADQQKQVELLISKQSINISADTHNVKINGNKSYPNGHEQSDQNHQDIKQQIIEQRKPIFKVVDRKILNEEQQNELCQLI